MTTPTVTFSGQQYDYQSLFNLSGPELVKIHNLAAPKAGVETTKRFSDKVSAVKRTWAILSKLSEGATVASAPSEAMKAADQLAGFHPNQSDEERTKRGASTAKPKAKAEPKEKKAAAPRKPRGKRFVFPKGEELKAVREGTHRAKLVQLLSREQGATFNQCLAATWGQESHMDEETQIKTCYEAMRLLHYYCGYGMRHLDDSANPHIQIYF